jgi:wyosine [tRNA(Phe)-imidazoG37] synthetase (radical SAM superfamily)
MTVEIAPPLATSTVYGPVRSWRVGSSLGVDMLFTSSICSFQCVYCQLGKILDHTAERKVYVSTEKVMDDLRASAWQEADVITFSGNGEPTLALNLPEVIHEIKAFTGKPVMVLTNATTLWDPQVRADLAEADRVFCKLDAADDATLQRVNRPVDGVTVRTIVEGIKALRAEYKGYLAVQMMFMPMNRSEIQAMAMLLNEIRPDEVQLNTPRRPVPREWHLESRGNHEGVPYPAVQLKTVDRDEALAIEQQIRDLTGLKVVSIYRQD